MGAGEVRAGKAFVEVYTKDSTKGGLDGIKAKLGAFGSQVAKIGGIAVTAATAAITASVMKAVSTGANIQDLADRYAIGTTAIQQLSYAAKMSGTDINTLIVGIKNMQKGLGNGTIGDELKKLGLSMSQLQGLAPERQFALIGDAIGRIADPAERTAMAMKLFGKSGTELIPLLGKVDELTGKFDKLGATMSEEAVKQAAELDDELETLGVQFDALVVSVGTKLIPAVIRLVAEANRYAGTGYDPLGKLLGGVAVMGDGELRPGMGRPRRAAEIVGTGNTPLGQFIASLGGRLGAANAVEQARRISDGLEEMQSMLLSVGVGRPQLRNGGIGYVAGMPSGVLGVMTAIQGYLSGSAVARSGGDIASFGTFDKRDVAGGAFLAATNQQLAEAKKTNDLLRQIKEKKPGVPWG